MAESERLEQLEPGLYAVVRSEDERRRLYNLTPERIRDLLTPVAGPKTSARPDESRDPRTERPLTTPRERTAG
jgi:hypothetical protein